MAFTKIAGPGILSTTDTTVGHGTYTGNLQVDGNISCAGTISYQDVSNIDSVGIITAQAGIHLGIGATVGKVDAATGITTFSSAVGIADSIFHVGNNDTSIRFPSDDTFTVETAGSEALRVDDSQRLLVGTDDGWGSSVKLHLASTGNTYATITSGTSHNSVLAFSDDGTERGSIDYDHNGDHMLFKTNGANGERLRINSSGYVGINTNVMSNSERLAVQFANDEMFELRSAAQELFQVWKEGSTEECRLNVKHNGSTKIHLRGNGKSYFNGGDIGIGTDSPTEKLHVIGQVGGTNPTAGSKWDIARFVAHDYSATNSGGLTIGAYWHNTTVAERKSYIQSSQNTDSGSTARALLLNPDGGSVGIGTEIPNATLDIVSNEASGYIASFRQRHTSNPASIWIDSPTDNNIRPTYIDMACAGNLHWSFGQAYGSHVNNTFHFSTSTLGDGETGSKLAITKAGKVGINSTIPVTTLDVHGDMSVAYNATHALRFYTQPKNNWSSISNTATDGNANLSFKVSQGEAMYMSYGKLVGIGTDNPDSLLTLNASSNPELKIKTSGTLRTALRADTGNSETILASHEGYPLVFSVSAGGGTAEKLRIESGGDVSIGGTDANTFTNYNTLTIGGAGASDGAGIDLERSDGNIYGRFFGDANGVQIQAAQSGDYIRFETNGANERLRIDSSGVISFDKGTTAAVTPSQTTTASIGGGAFSGGSSWFNHASGTDYFGVDGDHKLTNGTTYGKIVARNSNGAISNAEEAGHTWFLVCKTASGTLGNSNWVVEPVAGWKMAWPTSLADGATATFYMKDAVESYGSPTIPASGDYYIGWCYSTSQQMGTNGGSYYVDDATGGKIYYYSGEGDMSNAHQWIPRQGDSWDATMTGEKIHFKFETLPKADLSGTVFSSPLLVDPVMQGTPLVDGFPMAGGQLVKDVQWSNNVASVEFMNADFVNSNYLLTYSINATDGNDNTSGWYQTRMQFCDHDGSWKNDTNDYISHCEWIASSDTTSTINSSFAGYAKSMWLTGNGSNYDHMGWVWIIPSNFRHNRDTTIAQNWGDGTSYTISEHPHIMVRGHSFLTSGNNGQSYREEGGGIYRGSNDLFNLSGFRLFGCGSGDVGVPASNGASNGYVRIWRFKSGFEAREVS